VAKAIGYRPNRSAQSLRLGRTGTLGLLLPHLGSLTSRDLMNSDWYAQMALSVARAAFARDIALLMLPVDNDSSRFLPRVDGVIALDPTERDPRFAPLDQVGATIITLGHFDASRKDRRFVIPDGRGGVRILLDHMRAQGARRIAAFYVESNWSPLEASLQAYRGWMDERGLAEWLAPVDIWQAASLEQLREVTYAKARELLAKRDRPDAVLALFGGFGAELARAAHDLDLNCPQDVMIAQDVDGVRERDANLAITAVDLRADLQAAAAVDMLIGLLQGQEPTEPVVTPVDVHFRASTARTN
jgi:DNA-binding LacI/PurR family transcriptional regulator